MDNRAEVLSFPQTSKTGKLPKRSKNKDVRKREYLTEQEVEMLMDSAKKTGRHGHSDFELTLADCQVRDDNGMLKYRKARGREIPIYDVPKGIGYIERRRGSSAWWGCVWVKQQTVTDMLTLLPNVRPLFIALHECRIGRTRWIAGLTLVTKNPEDE